MNFYLVGGAIRDRLLGLEPEERDWVVVGATPDELASLGFKRLDAEFPVFAHPQSGEEYALARRERKTDPGHKGFVVEYGPDVTLEEDLLRRDLRINAIAESESGELIDPYGGQADIESRTLRHVSPAFVEDPLRILRVARFAARFDSLGFSIHPSTLELMRVMSSGDEMGALSSARIWRETEKSLATGAPARYFAELAECGALRFLLPESCTGVNSPDSAARRRFVLGALEGATALDGRAELRFAALLSALEATGDDGVVDRICDRFPVPGKHADLARLASGLHKKLSTGSPPRADRLLKALEDADAFRRSERFLDALLVCRALEAAGAGGLSGQIDALQRAFEGAREVDGAEISRAGITGPEIARELGRRRLTAVENSLAGSKKKR